MTRQPVFSIRRARPEDARGIHEAHMRSIQEICSKQYYTLEEINAWGRRPYNEEMRIATIEKGIVWVVEREAKIYGFAHVQIPAPQDPTASWLWGLYLVPEATGHGLGRELMKLVDQETTAKGLCKIQLEATFNALPFYEKQGFRRTSSHAVERVINGVPIRAFAMLKEIS